MLKERLYYADTYCKKFTTRVVNEAQNSEGNWHIELENTAFYPTGGGQPHDSGTLNGIQVLHVDEVDGKIQHTIAEHLNSAGEVEGIIDWELRFDHMQQHAGQHILTAAFVKLYNIPTVSFHLGKEMVTIDLDVEEVSTEQLDAVESLANEIILENRPIETKWVTQDEVEQYTLRKQVAVTDEIRLVIIPNFDYNGCGGTHPSSTGQINAIKILSTEKHRQKVRVHFVCGGRVRKQLHRKTQILTEASQLLSAPEAAIGDAVRQLLKANHLYGKSLDETHEALLTYEVKDLLQKKTHGIVKVAYKEKTVKELQKLARLLVAEDEYAIVLFVAESENQLQFVAARGKLVETSMKKVSSAALSLINGKGGGKDSFVQGGGERIASSEVLLKVMENSLGK